VAVSGRSSIDPVLPYEDATEILRVTGVPKKYQKVVRKEVESAVLRALSMWAGPSKRPPPLGRDAVLAAKRVATLCKHLQEAITELGRHNIEPSVQIGWAWDEDDEFSLFDLDERLNALSDSCRHLITPHEKKAPNRPRGSVAHPRLRLLIPFLYTAIVKLGRGKLTLGRTDTGEATGTLPATLQIVRRCSPELVPERLPAFSTLRRLMKLARIDAARSSAD
jgi:hypothetical protein